ncbi:MAG TPA: hypothetical protein VLM78_02375 [Anaerolineales bacterium]|nr:hypothetical protein [Anaerolineales bacterium]
MQIYDLCLAWNWEHDADFLRVLDNTCAARGLTLLNVSAQNLDEVLTRLARREAGFRLLCDRASEADPAYLPLVDIASALGARRLNPRELADRAYDKAALHHAFRDDGIPTPQTVILPAFHAQPDLPSIDLGLLGIPFTVKPAHGGGGVGVITDVSTREQVQAARTQFPEQQYLLQEHVTPKLVDGLPAWFRIIYCLGKIHPCFWDVTTHVYAPLPAEAENRLGLGSLREVTNRIARLCRLDLFSTEIALTGENRLLVVDYVNDPIDLRLQSRALDGVPDFIIEDIATRIVEEITKSQVC